MKTFYLYRSKRKNFRPHKEVVAQESVAQNNLCNKIRANSSSICNKLRVNFGGVLCGVGFMPPRNPERRKAELIGSQRIGESKTNLKTHNCIVGMRRSVVGCRLYLTYNLIRMVLSKGLVTRHSAWFIARFNILAQSLV